MADLYKNKAFKKENKAMQKQLAIDKKEKYNENRKISREYRSNKFSNFKSILSIIFAVIMIAVLVRFAVNDGKITFPTFRSFLEILTEVPAVEIPFLSDVAFLEEPWTLFDFIRVALQGLFNLIDVITFFINGLIQIILYVVYFFKWIFVF